MPEERICSTCGRTNPIDQPRCINCGQRAQGMMLVAEKPATTTSWWSGSATSSTGIIPAPPQVREEAERAETVRLDRERRQAERERRIQAARERDERRRAERQGAAAEETAVSRLYRETIGNKAGVTEQTEEVVAPAQAKRVAVQVDCPLCGEALETTTHGAGFSFCLRCGNTIDAGHAAELAAKAAVAAPAENFVRQTTTAASQTAAAGAATSTRRVTTAATVSVSESAAVGVSPGLAAVMSFFLPGIGQLVNGQVAKAALLFLAMFALLFCFHISPLGFVAIAARLMAAVDAYRIADRRRTGGPVRDGEWDLG